MECLSWVRMLVSPLKVSLFSGTIVGLSLASSLLPTRTVAQSLQSDGSLGTVVTSSGTLANPIYTVTGGRDRSPNLFHSFSQFSVPIGGTAIFDLAGQSNIQTIFSRVTGNTPSLIEGLIKTSNTAIGQNVSLFLMNPNGIVFSPTAQLDISGSFVATTAQAIQFPDQRVFDVGRSGDGLLSINLPIGLQMGTHPGDITVQNAGHQFAPADGFGLAPILGPSTPGLSVQAGRSLSLIGGNLNFQGGVINAVNSDVTLGSAGSDAIVTITTNASNGSNLFKFAPVPNQPLGNIHMSGRSIAHVSGTQPGLIDLWGQNLMMQDGSLLLSHNFGALPAQPIQVQVQDTLSISELSLDGQTRSGIFSEVFGSGAGADFQIMTQNLRLENGGSMATKVFGAGNAGKIQLTADRGLIQGWSRRNPLNTSLIGSPTLGTGRTGDLTLQLRTLELYDGGAIGSNTFSPGLGGNVSVTASDLIVQGTSILGSQSSIAASTYGPGESGSLSIQSDRIQVRDGGLLATAAYSSGSAKDIVINAQESILLSGTTSNGTLSSSGINSSALKPSPFLRFLLNLPEIPTGNAGLVKINSPQLTIQEGSVLGVTNEGQGNGGKLILSAPMILLQNGGSITASTVSQTGGDLNLVSDVLILRNGSRIEAISSNNGDGGNITINSHIIVGIGNSDIIANANQGRGGQIRIVTDSILGLRYRPVLTELNDITASSQIGLTGDVVINSLNLTPQPQQSQLSDRLYDKQAVTNPCDRAIGSTFIATGRGGLPSSPKLRQRFYRNWYDVRDIAIVPSESRNSQAPTPRTPASITEASALVQLSDGSLALVGAIDSMHPKPSTPYATCSPAS